ncbi:MAG: hypothetical protein AB7G80_07630 [Dongiaceae bacterium]
MRLSHSSAILRPLSADSAAGDAHNFAGLDAGSSVALGKKAKAATQQSTVSKRWSRLIMAASAGSAVSFLALCLSPIFAPSLTFSATAATGYPVFDTYVSGLAIAVFSAGVSTAVCGITAVGAYGVRSILENRQRRLNHQAALARHLEQKTAAKSPTAKSAHEARAALDEKAPSGWRSMAMDDNKAAIALGLTADRLTEERRRRYGFGAASYHGERAGR